MSSSERPLEQPDARADYLAKVDIAMRKAAQQVRNLAGRNGIHPVIWWTAA